jgi:hypothetical protein
MFQCFFCNKLAIFCNFSLDLMLFHILSSLSRFILIWHVLFCNSSLKIQLFPILSHFYVIFDVLFLYFHVSKLDYLKFNQILFIFKFSTPLIESNL